MSMPALKKTMKTLLSSGRKIKFEWDCGGDETLIDVFEDGKSTNAEWVEPLCEVVVEKLDLPNAGEFFVKGSGTLLLKGDGLFVQHESVASGIDYKIPEGVDPTDLDIEELEEYFVEFEEEPLEGTVELM